MMVLSYVPMLRTVQEQLMTDRVRIVRVGDVIANNVPCRITAARLFAEPADPHDANLRSVSEWGFTLPSGTDIAVSDAIEKTDGSLSAIVGEVVSGDTWETAVRVWATRPKSATPTVTVTLWRYQSGLDDFSQIGTYDVQVVFDRVSPRSTPIRYAPAGRSTYQGGTLIGDLDFTAEVDDRFTLDGLACVVTQVLPQQPQRIEAKFIMDEGGVY